MNVRNTFFAASLSTLAVASVLQADEPQPVPPQQQPAPQIQAIQQPNVRPSRRERRQGTWQIVQPTPATNPTSTQQPAPQQQSAAPAQQQAQAAPASNKPPTIIQSPPLVEQRRPGTLSRLFNRRASYTAIPPTVIQQPAGSQPLPTAK